jgi:hypothetical protein
MLYNKKIGTGKKQKEVACSGMVVDCQQYGIIQENRFLLEYG